MPDKTMRFTTPLRHELKYLINLEQRQAVSAALLDWLQPDAHGDAGSYTISSLYYDTAGYRAYWDKLEGHKVRRKVRVRTYGGAQVTPATPSYVEIKERVNAMMGKRRVALPYAQAVDFDAFDERPAGMDDAGWETLQEVYYLYRTLDLRPACVVTYERLALHGSATHPDLRVTFDTAVRGRVHDLSLRSTGHAADQYILPPDWCILEVKVNRSVPYWLTQILSEHRCTLRRISKYCAALEQSGRIRGRQRLAVTTDI